MARNGFGTNIDALRAQNSLASANQAFASTAERLSSGLRINSAGDDAAGLAISTSLQSSARVFAAGIRNLNDGISLLSVSENALEALASITRKQQELAAQAASANYTDSQREAINSEATALRSEFNRIVGTTRFNGSSLLSGETSLSLQGGFGSSGAISSVLNEALSHGQYDGTTFGNTVTGGALSSPGASLAADFDGDGADELVLTTTTNGSTNVYIRNGSDGTLLGTVATVTNGTAIAEDLNGDGRNDLIIWGGSGQTQVAIGNGDGTFQAAYTVASNTGAAAFVAVGDYNGDGKQDLIRTYTGSTSIVVEARFGNGDGTFRASFSGTNASFNIPMGLTVYDYNGDGRDDIITLSSSTNSIIVATGTTASTVTVGGSVAGGTIGGTILGTGDVDGDGDTDLVLSNSNSFQWLLRGASGFTLGSSITTTGNVTGVADFNDDGELDILSHSGTNAYLRFGNGDGTFLAATAIALNSAGSVNTSGWGDFNGDGNLDISAVQSSNTTAYINYQLPGSTLTTQEIDFDLSTRSSARAAMTRLDEQLGLIVQELGTVGGAQSRLAVAVSDLTNRRDGSLAAASKITDIDAADEAAQMIRAQVIQNAATAILAQANIAPQALLKLLG